MKNQGIIKEFQRGNALIIILIIIALLSALTITVTRMGESENDVSQEEAQVVASQVLRQAKTVVNGVEGLIAKGCSYTQLSFENATVTGYANAQSPSNKSCWLFDGSGAGLAFPVPPKLANDGTNWFFGRHTSIDGVGPERETLVGCTANCQEILMILPLVNLNVCNAINKLAGVTTTDNLPPKDDYILDVNLKFSAASTAPSVTNLSNANTSTGTRLRASGSGAISSRALWDKKSGCIETVNGYTDSSGANQSGTGKYFFYQVLVER